MGNTRLIVPGSKPMNLFAVVAASKLSLSLNEIVIDIVSQDYFMI